MNATQKKQYDVLLLKVEHIYLGATGKVCDPNDSIELSQVDGQKLTMAIFSLIDAQNGDADASDFINEYNNYDANLNDIEEVTDWLFEKGIR